MVPSGVSNLYAKLSVIGGCGVRNAVTFTSDVCSTTPSSVMSLAISSLRGSGRPSSSIRVSTSNLFSSQFGHRLDAFGAERLDRRRQAGDPGVVEQIAVFEIVIGMVVADENIFHRRDRHAGRRQLTADACAAIDHERRIVYDNEIGWVGWAPGER